MSGSFSWCDGQLASGDEGHYVGVVGVCRIKRHEARHAVDVATDASRRLAGQRVVVILSVGVHD